MTAEAPFALLSMYDRADLRPHTDALWTAIRDALRARGVAAPEALTRDGDAEVLWTDPGMVFGQTCGLPYVTVLRGKVRLVGTPDYGLEGCPPGWYRSALIARADHPAARLAEFAGAVPAVNGLNSQSGYAALLHQTAALAGGTPFFAAPMITGGHLASLAAVAEGRADIAAIDAVTWALSVRSGGPPPVRLLGWTDPTPGLPYITALSQPAETMAEAVSAAIAALPEATRAALMLKGTVPLGDADYDLVEERHTAARAAHGLAGGA